MGWTKYATRNSSLLYRLFCKYIALEMVSAVGFRKRSLQVRINCFPFKRLLTQSTAFPGSVWMDYESGI